jgi:hypothetical protein
MSEPSVTPTKVRAPTVSETPFATKPAPGIVATDISPAPIQAPVATPSVATNPDSSTESDFAHLYLPFLQSPTVDEAIQRPPRTTEIVATDFDVVRSELEARGQGLAFSKIGFHVTLLLDEDLKLLLDQLRRLDEAGVPFFLKSASNAEPLYLAQEMMKVSGMNHTLVYRSTAWDVPEYHLSPELAAERHWQRHRDAFPPELDPSLVWIETVNEVDKNLSEWLALFALKTAQLAMSEGFRWAAFGWASGEPEPEHWQSSAMLDFLRLAGENPDRLAIALHEYSLVSDEITDWYPFKVGRFLELFRIADEHGIPRPTILITEWGWGYDSIPEVNGAMEDIRWASALYAPFPQVKGAAIWNFGRLGCCSDELSEIVKPLVTPLTEYGLVHYFAVPALPAPASTNPDIYRP